MRLVDKSYFCFMNEDVKNKINHMLPPQLEEAKKLIDLLITTKPNQRVTNLEYLERTITICCPVNETHHIKKNGHKNNTQRIWCYDCKKSYSITHKSILEHSILNYYQLKKLLQSMYDFKSLDETSQELGIDESTVFESQIRIFDALDELNCDVKLGGIVQADEKYIRINLKGTPSNKMPRPSRHNGSTNLTSGISKDQICVIVALDENDNLIIRVAGNGNASTNMISKVLNGKINSGSTLVTDSKNSYDKFAELNNLKLIKIAAGMHKQDNYSINDVNQIMSEIETYLNIKRGISTRHLQHHMNFIQYRKKIKYTIEYLDRNEKMYVDAISLKIRLKSNDVYSTPMPFDIDDYKEWYKRHHD